MPRICSAIGTTGFGQWIWYRSSLCTPRRVALARPCFSMTLASGITGSIFVARKTSSLRCAIARPTMRSDSLRP